MGEWRKLPECQGFRRIPSGGGDPANYNPDDKLDSVGANSPTESEKAKKGGGRTALGKKNIRGSGKKRKRGLCQYRGEKESDSGSSGSPRSRFGGNRAKSLG